jgi:excisionase family DNA binding protein
LRMQKGGFMLDELDKLYDVTSVAAYFEVNPVTIRRWARSGRLPARRIGPKLRFKKEDLEAFLRPAAGVPWRRGAAGSKE